MQALLLRGFVGSKMKLPMLVTVIVLDGLQGVGVMADEHIGSSVYQHVGIVPLTGYGLQRMFATPVERDDDDGGGVSLTETEDALEQRVHRFLTHAGLIGQVGVVFKGEAQRGYQPYLAGAKLKLWKIELLEWQTELNFGPEWDIWTFKFDGENVKHTGTFAEQIEEMRKLAQGQ